MRKAIILAICSIILFCGVAAGIVWGIRNVSLPASTKISIRYTDAESVHPFDVRGLMPGTVASRRFEIEGRRSGKLSLTFEEDGEVGLVPYLQVKISENGKTLFNGAMSELLPKTLKFSFDGSAMILIEYGLPLDTGNEAQKQGCDIRLNFKLDPESES